MRASTTIRSTQEQMLTLKETPIESRKMAGIVRPRIRKYHTLAGVLLGEVILACYVPVHRREHQPAESLSSYARC